MKHLYLETDTKNDENNPPSPPFIKGGMGGFIMFVILLIAFTIIFSFVSKAISAKVSHGEDIIYTKPVKSVIFSHKVHVEDKGLGCDMCHSGIFDTVALKIQKKSDFNMGFLYKGKYCGACHNGQMAFASNTQCARCHIGVKGYTALQKTIKPEKSIISGPKDLIVIGKGDSSVKFSHEKHTKSLICGNCHSADMFHMTKGKTKITMKEIYQGEFCGTCHDGKKSFSSTNCSKCHEKTPMPKTVLTYMSKGIGIVKFSHNFHTKVFRCNKCHKKLFVMRKDGSKMKMDAMYNGKFCGVCHNGSIASNVTDCGKCHKDK